MTSGRLFEILYYLLDIKQTTAKELAEHFEVSQRTIYRDLDRLLVAGIPIQTQQGHRGGISIDENFVMDKKLLNTKEQDQILLALESLSSLQLHEYDDLLQHMQSIFQKKSQQWIEVDFSSWHKNEEMNLKFNLLRTAILQYNAVSFDYINAQAQHSQKYVYPVKILFKGNAWYLQSYDKNQNAYRTYRLSRMSHIHMESEIFGNLSLPEVPHSHHYHEDTSFIQIKLQFQKHLGSFVYDEFEYQDIEELDNVYIVKTTVPHHAWLTSFLLSFGKGVEVIEPQHLKDDIKKEIEQLNQIYNQT